MWHSCASIFMPHVQQKLADRMMGFRDIVELKAAHQITLCDNLQKTSFMPT